MKKFFRLIFSGMFLVFFALIIELIAFVFVQFFLDDVLVAAGMSMDDVGRFWYYFVVYVLRFFITIVAFIIFFRIVNKSEDPEFKIPWIVGMLLLPFFTSIMYLIFGNHGLSKRDRRIVHESHKAYAPYLEKLEDKEEQAAEELGDAFGAFSYLKNTTHLGYHKNCKVTYFKNGEVFFPDFIRRLREAEEFIFIEFFIISDGQMRKEVQEVLIEKAKAGVDVKIVYDDMGCGGTISYSTPQILGRYGIKCVKFHPFRPIMSGVFNNRDHRKIVVIDHKYAYTGGINLSDEYANIHKRFGYWKDTMVRIEGSAINNLIVTFLQNYNLAARNVEDIQKYLSHEYEKYDDSGCVMPFGDGPGSYDDYLIGEQNYINILNYAKKSVFISTPYLIPTYSLTDALRNAALRGVDVNLIVPGIPDKKLVYKIAQSNFKFLMEAGVKIWIYSPGFNHMKSAIADDELAFVGTINFDFRSLVHHFECGTLLYKNECLKEVRADFDEMIEQSKRVPDDFKQTRRARFVCVLMKLFTPLF